MKRKLKLIVIFIFLSTLFFVLIPVIKALTTSYENIDLNQLNEIKDNQDLLDTVINVDITHESDLSLVSILSRCNNLKNLTIRKASIDNLKFINDIKSNDGFTLRIDMGYYNIEGISNSYIKEFIISSSYVTNFSKGMDLPNVERINIENISGYEDIDYSMYTNLKSLSFGTISIDNYEVFFNQLKTLNNLRTLIFFACDINDKDMKYLSELTNITSLGLGGCHITDISSLEKMKQLTYLKPPINVEDLSVVKKLPNLRTIYWSGYEQLALTDDLVKYLDDNNIEHNKYEKTLKNSLLNMINNMNINENMSIKEKIETVIDYTSNYVVSHDEFYDEIYTTNSLLYIVHYKTGVCSSYSYLQHALLRLIGVDTYYIGGLIPVYMSELDGNFYVDELKYELAGHAWLMTQDENKLWYGWDPVQIDVDNYGYSPPWNTVWGKKYNFWKNPFEDDDYTLDDYQNGKYDSFNYNFAKRRIITNKIGYKDYLNESKIIFDSNNENSIQTKQRVYKNVDNKLNKNLFTRDKYIFKSWNTKSDGEGISYQDEEIININENLILYAQWEPETYTVKFFPGSGNGIMEDVTGIVGDYILPKCEFVSASPGLEFDGWYIPTMDIIVKPGSIIYVNDNVELIARWKEKTKYIVTFDTAGGSFVESQMIISGNYATEPKKPVKDGYKFFGWYEDSTLQFRFNFNTQITADTKIYAKWVKNEKLINNININVELPTVGDAVTIEKIDEYYWDWYSQKPQMKITLPNDANYHLFNFNGEGNYMQWIESFDDIYIPFIGTFEYNSDYYAKIYIETNSGYFLSDDVEVIVNGKTVDKILYLYDNYIELGVKLTAVSKDKDNIYKIVDGENKTYVIEEDNDFIVKANGEISKFNGLKVDDKLLESFNYTVVSGSTVVTLKKEYLNTLTEGNHKLTFIYLDGEVSTNFSIVKKNIKDDSNIITDNDKNNVNREQDIEIKEDTISNRDNNIINSSPKTGDNIMVWFVLAIISIFGILGIYKIIRRN